MDGPTKSMIADGVSGPGVGVGSGVSVGTGVSVGRGVGVEVAVAVGRGVAVAVISGSCSLPHDVAINTITKLINNAIRLFIRYLLLPDDHPEKYECCARRLDPQDRPIRLADL